LPAFLIQNFLLLSSVLESPIVEDKTILTRDENFHRKWSSGREYSEYEKQRWTKFSLCWLHNVACMEYSWASLTYCRRKRTHFFYSSSPKHFMNKPLQQT
jgi:hypothetical protein